MSVCLSTINDLVVLRQILHEECRRILGFSKVHYLHLYTPGIEQKRVKSMRYPIFLLTYEVT